MRKQWGARWIEIKFAQSAEKRSRFQNSIDIKDAQKKTAILDTDHIVKPVIQNQ
jgi:hypothetical protein